VNFWKSIALIFVLILIGTSGYGQTNLWDTVRLKEARVIGKLQRSALRIQKLDSLELQNNSGGDLANLLARNTPVFIKTAAPGSLATISMRGTLASHTRVSWNGIMLNSPMLGQVDFSLIPTFFTDRVQILSGPGSIQKGSGALGGHIDLTSQGRWDDNFYGSVSTSIGSFNTYRWMVDIGGNSGKFQSRIRLFRMQSENNFPFLNTANGLFNRVEQQNSEYEKQGLLAQLFYRPNSHHLLSLNAWLQMSDRNLPSIMSYEGSGRDEYQTDNQVRVSSSWQYTQGAFNSKLNSGFSVDKLHYFLANQTSGGLLVNYDSRSESQSFYNNYLSEYAISNKHKLSLQLHSNYHRVEIRDIKSGPGYTAQRLENGVQLKASQNWNQRFYSYALIQQDWNGIIRNPLVPSLGASFQVIKDIAELKASAGKNFHLPTLNDLYWIPGGNPDLLPEEGYMGDLGIKTMLTKDSTLSIEAELTGFISYIDNWILWKPGEFQYWSPENLETVLARGFESRAHISKQLKRGKLELRANYTFTRTNQIGYNNTGAQLIYIPVHKANSFIYFSRKQNYITYNYSFTSERFTSTEEELSLHRLPAYSLHDLSIGRKMILWKLNTDIRFDIHNLLNKDYQSILWRAMPGRYYTLHFKIDF